MSRVYFLACILMLISFTLSQCPPPSFPPLTVTANVVGAIPTDLYIDAENIYCPGSQAAQGGCETGYHDHTQFNVSASPTTISRNRVSTQTGPQGLLPLYVTHLSFRFYESQLVSFHTSLYELRNLK